jgi:hypothetical protein
MAQAPASWAIMSAAAIERNAVAIAWMAMGDGRRRDPQGIGRLDHQFCGS